MKYYYFNYIKENEIGGACIVNGAAAKCRKIQSGILREHDIWETYEIRRNTVIQI
jgi:hypothetical protein